MTKKDEKIINEFLDYMKHEMKKRDNTIKSYRTALVQFFSEYQDFEKITRKQINQYKSQLSKTSSPATVHLKISAIGSFYNYVVDEMELLEMTPVYKIKLPEIESKIMSIPQKSEINAEIKSLKQEGQEMLALSLLIGSRVGLRIGEVINLNIEDINFEDRIFNLYGTKTKNHRQVAVNKETLSEIKEYCKKNRLTKGRLLRNKSMQPMTNSWMHKLVKEHCKNHFHLNRHFCISTIAEKEGIYKASLQAGHSSSKITERVYAHISMKSQVETLDNVWK